MKLILSILTLLFVVTAAMAQPPDTLWTRVIDIEDNCSPRVFRLTSDGGMIVLFGLQTGLLKLDSLGNPQWERVYPGAPTGITVTSSHRYAICGWYWGSENKAFAALLDSVGDTLWTHTYVGTQYFHGSPTNILETADHALLLCGDWGYGGGTERGAFFTKISMEGDSLWSWDDGHYSSWGYSSIADMVRLSDGRIAAAYYGVNVWYQYPHGPWHNDYFGKAALVAAMGDSILGSFTLPAHSVSLVCRSEDGGYVIVGRTGSDSTCTWRLNANDTLVCTSQINGTVRCIRPSPGNGFITISTLSTPSDSGQIQLRRFDSTGVERWNREFGGTGQEIALSIENTSDGGYLVGGTTNSFGAFGKAIYLIRIAPDQPLVANPGSAQIPSNFFLSCYPNPFNPSTVIQLNLPRQARAVVVIHDLLGRHVATLYDGMLKPGEHKFTFDGSNLPSGIYFASVQAGEFVKTQKLLLLK